MTRRARADRPARGGGRPSAAALDRAQAEDWMRLALAEAARGLGRTSPNPAVGARGGARRARWSAAATTPGPARRTPR